MQFRYLGEKLNRTKMEDWYKVIPKDFTANHGEGLLYKYKSASNVVTSVFGEHQWEIWKFSAARITWDDAATKNFMRYL